MRGKVKIIATTTVHVNTNMYVCNCGDADTYSGEFPFERRMHALKDYANVHGREIAIRDI